MARTIDNYKGVFGNQLGFGLRPAVLVIDFVKAYTTPGSLLYAPAVRQAIDSTKKLLAQARDAEIPIIFTRVLYHLNLKDGGLFVRKIPALACMTAGQPLAEIVDDLKIEAEDLVLTKQYASAFFGTSLAATLCSQSIDTLVITGCSTSGCVRATAVDAMQHGFRVVIPEECVADRDPAPHAANLFDIAAKYGDVLSLSEVIERLPPPPVRS